MTYIGKFFDSRFLLRSMTMWLAALCMAATLASPAQARRDWPVTGGNGDAAVQAICPGGEMLVGFSGRVGLWLDQIQLMCAKPLGTTMGAPHSGSDQLGGFGGGPSSAVCDRNSRLHSVAVAFTANYKQVARIQMVCASLTSGNYTSITFGGSYSGVAKSCGALVGCSVEEVSAQAVKQACPQEQFVGANLRIGAHVNAIGFICDGVNIPAAAAAVPQKAQVKAGPTSVSALAFGGAWKSVTNQNGHYDIIITVTNPNVNPYQFPLVVVGTFINTDGAAKYNGSFQGQIYPGQRILNYSYTQPGASAAGIGQFTLSSDGKSISGTGVDQTTGTSFTWTGTRK